MPVCAPAAGRTGRAGRSGTAIAMFTRREIGYFKRILRETVRWRALCMLGYACAVHALRPALPLALPGGWAQGAWLVRVSARVQLPSLGASALPEAAARAARLDTG